MYYLKYFFLYSILGHLIETIFVPNFNSGILYGYWTPIYGIGVILILVLGKEIDKIPLKGKRIYKVFITYLICMLVLSLIELLGGYLIEWLFNREFWNYEHHRFNIGTYISLEMANLWGIASILMLYVLKPISDKFIKYIPNIVVYILILLFIVDTSVTIIKR